MATLVISNSGSGSNSNMKCRITYTAGNGNITITNIENCRTDGYDTNANTTSTSDNIVYLSIGGTQVVASHNNWIYFKKNSTYTSNWSGSASRSNLQGSTNITVSYKCTLNSNIDNAVFSTSIDAGYAYPTIKINNAGSSTSNKATISYGSSLSFSFTLGQMGGRTGTLTYDNVSLGTYSSDNTYTATIPASAINNYINNHINEDYFSIAIKIAIGSFTATANLYVVMNANIKPTLSSITISGSNSSYPSLVNKFVQGLTRPKITMSGSGIYNSKIVNYYLTGVTNYSAGLFPKTVTPSSQATTSSVTYEAVNTFPSSGSVTATGYCIDSRLDSSSQNRSSLSITSSAITVIPYSTPSCTATVKRCLQNGTEDNDGTYCKLTVNYNFAPINDGSNNLNTKSIQYSLDGNNWNNITLSGWSGTDSLVIPNATFDVAQNYNIYIKYSDVSTTQTKTYVLEVSFTLISRHTGGDGVTLGKIATQSGFHDYLGANFHNGLSINGTSILDLFYPVGSIYMSTTRNANTVNTTGKVGCPIADIGGTWERIQGKFLLGANDSSTPYNAGQTGGAVNHTPSGTVNSHTLTVNEIPSHRHNAAFYNSSWTTNNISGGAVNAAAWGNYSANGGKGYRAADSIATYQGGGQGHSHGFTGTSQDTMPPFLAVYVWKRTA